MLSAKIFNQHGKQSANNFAFSDDLEDCMKKFITYLGVNFVT